MIMRGLFDREFLVIYSEVLARKPLIVMCQTFIKVHFRILILLMELRGQIEQDYKILNKINTSISYLDPVAVMRRAFGWQERGAGMRRRWRELQQALNMC